MGQDRDGRGGVSFVSQGNGSVVGIVLNDDFYRPRYFQLDFPSQAPRCHDGDGFSDPTGTGGDENIASFPQGLDVAYHMIGTQTLLAPTMDYANGVFLAGLDQAAGDGVEYLFGAGLNAGNPLALTIGADAALAQFLKLQMVADTVGNIAECAVGFRKAAAFDAALDNYTDFAVLNLQFDTTDAFVRIETNLNGAGTVTVESGSVVIDDEVFTFEVRVTANGQATFYFNGAKVGPSFQFDVGDVVLPFMHWLQVTGGSSLGWAQAHGGALWHLRKDVNRR
jgi:hypothetical protein